MKSVQVVNDTVEKCNVITLLRSWLDSQLNFHEHVERKSVAAL